MDKRAFTAEELQSMFEVGVDMGRKLERCALKARLETLIVGATAMESRAAEDATAATTDEARALCADAYKIHHTSAACYKHLAGKFGIEDGFGGVHTLAPEPSAEEREERMEKMQSVAMDALRKASEELGLGTLIEATCGCCDTRMLVSAASPTDRCPRCVGHKKPEEEKAH